MSNNTLEKIQSDAERVFQVYSSAIKTHYDYLNGTSLKERVSDSYMYGIILMFHAADKLTGTTFIDDQNAGKNNDIIDTIGIFIKGLKESLLSGILDGKYSSRGFEQTVSMWDKAFTKWVNYFDTKFGVSGIVHYKYENIQPNTAMVFGSDAKKTNNRVIPAVPYFNESGDLEYFLAATNFIMTKDEITVHITTNWEG